MDYPPLTDEEIIRHLVQGSNPRLFDELFRRHESRVLRQCRRLNDAEAALDVSQEVWIRVHLKLANFSRCALSPPGSQ